MSTRPQPLTNVAIISFAWSITGGWWAMFKGKDFWFSLAVTGITYGSWSTHEWCSTVISVTPSLLGFTLSGFAIFLGFGSDDFKSMLVRDDEKKSPYLSTSAAFLVFVVVQLIGLIYALCAQSLYFPTPKLLLPLSEQIKIASIIGGGIGYLIFIYGLILSLRAGMRIFRLSRWLHMHLLKLEEEKERCPSCGAGIDPKK